MLFPFQKYTSRREIDTSIFTSPWTAFLNSSIQTSPLLLACCSRLFSARSNRVERCVLRSLRFGLAGSGGGGGFRFTEPHPHPRTWQMDSGTRVYPPDNDRGNRDTPTERTRRLITTRFLKDLYFALVPLASTDDGSPPSLFLANAEAI